MRQKAPRINHLPRDRRFSAHLSGASSVSGFNRAADHSHCIQPQAPKHGPQYP
jgi:hypothetical protein